MPSTEPEARVDSGLSCHFTYCSPKGSNLQQGDVLKKSDQLTLALKEHFPYYLRGNFAYFIVLSQSCDLIIRDTQPCEAQHITLAAVRPLSLVLEFELGRYQNDFEKAAMVCNADKKRILWQFHERLLNNNHPEYFYLHEEPGMNFPDSSVALLRLSISLEAQKYYDTCLNARIISLTNVFQAKLGWLVGNMYSRVGTEDWVPDYLTIEEFRSRIDDALDRLCPWIPDKQIKEAKRSAPPELLSKDYETIRKHITETRIPRRIETASNRVIQILKEFGIATQEDEAKRIRNRVISDPDLSVILR